MRYILCINVKIVAPPKYSKHFLDKFFSLLLCLGDIFEWDSKEKLLLKCSILLHFSTGSAIQLLDSYVKNLFSNVLKVFLYFKKSLLNLFVFFFQASFCTESNCHLYWWNSTSDCPCQVFSYSRSTYFYNFLNFY